MILLVLLVTLGLSVAQTSSADQAPQTMSQKREVLQPEIAITTLSAAALSAIPAARPVEHDSEVSRTESIMVVVTIQGCQADAAGACDASADVVAYTPDGAVHDELNDISLKTRRGTAVLNLAPADATGIYKVVATVRDLRARRFGKAERLFGVK